jgi:glycosyltransferase involved in cell wall biosynthesis
VIAIDYTPAYEQGGGIGRLTRHLVEALLQEDPQTSYRLWVSGYRQATPLPNYPNAIWRTTRITPKNLARLWHRLHVPLPIESWVGRVKLYYATDFVLPPTLPQTKTAVFVHDLSFVRVPETTAPSLKRYLDAVVPHSVRRATHVIANSEATKADYCDAYNIMPEKITVLPLGVEARFYERTPTPETLLRRYGVPSNAPYFLCVGTVQPRKNYSRVIRALARLREEGFDVSLLIVGGQGWLEDEMYATLEETRMSHHVRLTGFVDDADLPHLYRSSLALVFPSLYEGFGFPILESMASGVPVITSNLSSMPEIAGNAALTVNPYDVEDITHAMRQVLQSESLRQTLILAGLERAKMFTWERAGRELHNLFSRIATQG